MDAHDHRLLGPRLDLFHQQEEGPGMAFWHPRGATIYRLIENYIRREMSRAGFQEVRTPQLRGSVLWAKARIRLEGSGRPRMAVRHYAA